MNDTVSDGAVTHFSQTAVQSYRVIEKKRVRAFEPECQQTTDEARTIDARYSSVLHFIH